MQRKTSQSALFALCLATVVALAPASVGGCAGGRAPVSDVDASSPGGKVVSPPLEAPGDGPPPMIARPDAAPSAEDAAALAAERSRRQQELEEWVNGRAKEEADLRRSYERPGSEPEHADARLTLHVSDTPGCGRIDPGSFDCNDVDLTGNGGREQYVFVLLQGTADVRQVRFDVDYERNVKVTDWTPCDASAATLPGRGWPRSGSTAVVGWTECRVIDEGAVVLGFFTVKKGARGQLAVRNPKGSEALVDCGLWEYRFMGEYLGRISTNGEREGPKVFPGAGVNNPCPEF